VLQLTPPEMDRVAGVMVGMAAGDALGAGYEFGPPSPPVPEMIGGGLGDWQPGEWTDDTQMALCVAESAATGRLDPEVVAARFLYWYRSGPADVGVQTRAVLSSTTTPAAVAGRAAAYFDVHPSRAAGNGSLMRTAPVALAHLGDDRAIAAAARDISNLTHADPIAGDACVLWCIAIDRAIRQSRLDGAHDGLTLLPAERRTFWTERLAEAESQPPNAFNPNGYVVDAFQAASSAVARTPIPDGPACRHLHDALHTAVGIGDDTDTVAAIAGALLGARWGATAVPARWQTRLHGWPGEYRTSDLVRLAVLSARRGRSDRAGWPATSSLAGYYHKHFPARPLMVALAEDPGVRLGNVAGLSLLTDHPADVVVSLCRIGAADIPAGVIHHQVGLIDEPGREFNPNLDFLLADLAEQIAGWRTAGKTVFVHCVRAESRTPTVAAAYLAHRDRLSGRAAIERVTLVLPNGQPNPGFIAALTRSWPEQSPAGDTDR
jgi:ADP-ribosylglycohydrolase/protein-tyrosine phosphatase